MPVRSRFAGSQSIDCDIVLQPKQIQLLRYLQATGPDIPVNIGYGGSRGGAKSGGAQRCALTLALDAPKRKIMIFRRLYDDLLKNHINEFLDAWPWLSDYYESTKKRFHVPGGSVIDFVHAETEMELRAKTRGQQWQFMFVDQAEELPEDLHKRLNTCNRVPNTRPGDCKKVDLFNPGGPGNSYLRRVYYLKQYKERERPSAYAFIQSYGWDNYEWFRALGTLTARQFYELSNDARFELYISQTDYGMKMNELPESLRMGELLGRFDAFAGQYYIDVWDEVKCILTMNQCEQIIQPWWNRWTATDWGFHHNAAHIWFATGKLSPDQFGDAFGRSSDYPVDVVIAYREMVTSNTGEADLAQMIADKTPGNERRLIRREFLSPDAWAKRGSANTIQEQLGEVWAREKLPLPDRADDDRVGGWRLIYNGLKQTCAMLSENKRPDQARYGPMLLVSANCPQIINAIPSLMRDEKNLEDVLKTNTLEDDVADCLRYGYKSMMGPKSKAPADVRALEVWNSKPDPTDRAIAMLQFRQKEARNLAIRQPRRGR